MDIRLHNKSGLGESSVFEQLFNLIDDYRYTRGGAHSLQNFYDSLKQLESEFNFLKSENKNSETLEIYDFLIHEIFSKFILVFTYKGISNDYFFNSFKRLVAVFSFCLDNTLSLKNRKLIEANFYENFPSLLNDFEEITEEEIFSLFEGTIKRKLSPNQDALLTFVSYFPVETGLGFDGNLYFKESVLEDESFVLPIYANDFIQKNLVWVKKTAEYTIESEVIFTHLNITIKDNENKADKLLYSLWAFISAISQAEDTKVEIITIKKGSIKTKLKILWKNIYAKNESKAIIEATKEGVVKALSGGSVSYKEVKKSIQEETKADYENEILRKTVETSQSKEELEILRALDLERKMLENEKMKIEIANSKIQLYKTISELSQNGVLEADFFQLDINDATYLLKVGDKVKETLPDIDELT